MEGGRDWNRLQRGGILLRLPGVDDVSDQDDVKSTWYVDGWARPKDAHHVTMRSPLSRTCNNQCPWLVANHGRTVELAYDHEVPDIPMPEGPYSFEPWKRACLWEDGLKDGVPGYGALCHVRLEGTQRQPGNVWDIVGRQCTGALVVQQREVLRQVERGESTLSVQGAARVASDMLGREVTEHQLGNLDLRELLRHAHPSLLDPGIGSDAAAPPLTEGEIQEWERLRGPVK
jgi:hypothetical protein